MRSEAPLAIAWQLVLLWGGWLIAPAAWGLHLLGSYLLVPPSCRWGHAGWLHAMTAGTFALALLGLAFAWRLWRRARRRQEGRLRLMALAGLGVSLYSALIILLEGLPNFIVGPCQ